MGLYLAIYDIQEDSARAHVAKQLTHFGLRVQLSVFEVRVSPKQRAELQLAVGRHLSKRDSFAFYPVDERQPDARLEWQQNPTRWGTFIELGAQDGHGRAGTPTTLPRAT